MIAMESEFGIPTVAVHVKVFAKLVESVARARGMPRARQAFVPVPMFNQPAAVLRGYVEGDDPVHGARVRSADDPAVGRRPQRIRLGPLGASDARARHRGEPSRAVPREPLD